MSKDCLDVHLSRIYDGLSQLFQLFPNLLTVDIEWSWSDDDKNMLPNEYASDRYKIAWDSENH